MFNPVDPRQSFPALEEALLQYWREEDTFKRSLQLREKGDVFRFYDGPPFATGLPHYGHILAGTIKDVIPRYQTMRGKYVRRRFGWDCHGLPVENAIEKEHKLFTKKDIEALGIGAFNDLCRSAVQRYAREWRVTVERMGRWVDMDWDYRTMDPDYMESIWWVFKQLYDRGLIYEGYKPMFICPRCQTPLSNFEVTQGYKDIVDHACTAMFALRDEPRTFVLAWTTTPWTLPGNLFLAVHPEAMYVRFVHTTSNISYISSLEYLRQLAPNALGAAAEKEVYRMVGQPFAGSILLGKMYHPPFPFFTQQYAANAFRIVQGDFVTMTEGTGIVHIAPGFGADDFAVGKREGTPMLQHVGMDGHFNHLITDASLAGLPVKPKDKHTSTDRIISTWLKNHERLFSSQDYKHSYPHCWRCDTPLLNYATSSWFVAVEGMRSDMLQINEKSQWLPDSVRTGRFGNWLEGALDWAISRNRYWGTPLPIWRDSTTGAIDVIGSRDALMQKVPGRCTKITIARHAESAGNVQQIYQGKEPGTNLTAQGKKQALALATQVKDDPTPLQIIYCSPLARTQQTAAILAKKTGARIVIDDRLREVSFGEYEGTHIDFEDLAFSRDRRAHKLSNMQVESMYHFPGMETWDEIEMRCRSFLEDILPRHRHEHIAIVTHADIIMNFTHLFTGLDKHKIVHQPYPHYASRRTFYYDHVTRMQLDLHRETVDDMQWEHDGHDDTARCVDLTLVRHGQTDWNMAEKVQGHTDLPLNATGIAQAEELAATLDPRDYDIILSSHLSRAKETASILAAKWEKEHRTHALFAERHFGEWEGKTKQDILREFPHLLADFIRHVPDVPAGESLADFRRRIDEGRAYLLSHFAGKRVLLVSHGRWIATFLERETGTPIWKPIENTSVEEVRIAPKMKRIPEVLDCWFESGSMPYAQEHFPFEEGSCTLASPASSKKKVSAKQLTSQCMPSHFPADFIAEGVDQTRGWFYTLTVLSTALFHAPAFKNCIVNGIVLAEDGKKMSKKLKNYPEPTDIAKTYGADSVRFALMSSPAVRGEDLRFSATLVEETMRSVLLPLWNAYNLFVTYANAASWEKPKNFSLSRAVSKDPLDLWILASTQDLVNKMTAELDQYDLSATCSHLRDSIDGLTNWYVRLNRRRLAGKTEGQNAAFDTLYRVLLTLSQLLAPFCPFLPEAIYLNLVGKEHDSIHFTDWPKTKKLTANDLGIIALMRNTQTVVTLGLSLRNDAKIKVRCPLSSVTFALSPSDKAGVRDDIIRDELNVKQVLQVQDPGTLAKAYARVDARKVGPRLPAKVQDIIKAGKEGNFTQSGDSIMILGETLSSSEAQLMYASAEGHNVAADRGIVVSLDTTVTDALRMEGLAREIIRAVQRLRKERGLSFTDHITLQLIGADDILLSHRTFIEQETRSTMGVVAEPTADIVIDGRTIGIRFASMTSSAHPPSSSVPPSTSA